MKKLLASAALFAAISACSPTTEEAAAPAEEVVEGPAMGDYVGDWNVTTPDGATHVTTNNADGTFTRAMADGASDGGSWTFADGQGCWTVEGEEEACYTVSEEDITGEVTLTAADGAVTVAKRVVEDPTATAEPVEAEAETM